MVNVLWGLFGGGLVVAFLWLRASWSQRRKAKAVDLSDGLYSAFKRADDAAKEKAGQDVSKAIDAANKGLQERQSLGAWVNAHLRAVDGSDDK